jgi:SAM-dependent methyltransferase
MKQASALTYGGAQIWDERSEEHVEEGSQITRKWVQKFLPFMLHHKVKTVLDLGCGLGYDSLILAKNGMQVFGVDHSDVAIEHAIETAKTQGVHLDYAVGDAAKPLDVESNSYDAVFSNMVLHSFPAKILNQVVGEIERSLHPGGYLLFTANSIDDMPIRTAFQGPATQIDGNFYELAGGQSMHFLTEDFVRSMLADWTIIELEQLASTADDGKVIKYFWKCIAQKKQAVA